MQENSYISKISSMGRWTGTWCKKSTKGKRNRLIKGKFTLTDNRETRID